MNRAILFILALLVLAPAATAYYIGWGSSEGNTYGRYGYAPYASHPVFSAWQNRPEGYLQYAYDGPSAYPRSARYCDDVTTVGHYSRWQGRTYYSAYTGHQRVAPRARALPHCQARYPLLPNRLILP